MTMIPKQGRDTRNGPRNSGLMNTEVRCPAWEGDQAAGKGGMTGIPKSLWDLSVKKSLGFHTQAYFGACSHTLLSSSSSFLWSSLALPAVLLQELPGEAAEVWGRGTLLSNKRLHAWRA